MAHEYENDNAEYHLGDEDAIYEPQEDNAKKDDSKDSSAADSSLFAQSSNKVFMKRRITVLVIGSIITIFIVYKLFTIFFGSKDIAMKTVPIKKKGAAQGMIKPQTTTIPPLTIESSLPVSAKPEKKKEDIVQSSAESTNMDEHANKFLKAAETNKEYLANLRQENEKLMAQIEHQQLSNQSRIGVLEDRISSLEGGIDGLDRTIRSLTTQLQHNQVSQKTLNEYKARLHKSKEQVVRHNKRYYVKAVIPGRAWLVGVDGTALTVRVGNAIPGYGKVVAINSYDGTITTSSGIKIYYGSGDQ